MNIQGWFPFWLVGSPCSPRDPQEPSSAPQFESINSSSLSHLYGSTLTFVHDYWKNHSFDIQTHCGSSSFYEDLPSSCWLQASWGEGLWFHISSPLPTLYLMQQMLSVYLVPDRKSCASAKAPTPQPDHFKMGWDRHKSPSAFWKDYWI